jgi:protein MpaA
VKVLLAVVSAALISSLGAHAGRAGQPSDPTGRRTVTLGRSIDGRVIYAVETGDLDSARRALVVGCIHGNECAGIAVANRLARTPGPGNVDLWILPNLNPDGAAAGTRTNARGVDLNRNFPWRWRQLEGTYDSGQAPLSERETRIAHRLIERLRPSVSIWFHQHLDLVDDSGGSTALERRFAAIAGLRVAPLAREPGSATTWENHCFPRGSAFVVELPAGSATTDAATRLVAAARATVAAAIALPPAVAAGCTA